MLKLWKLSALALILATQVLRCLKYLKSRSWWSWVLEHLGTSWNILEPSNRLFLTGILSVRELHPTWQVLELSPTWIGRSVLYRRCRLAMLGSPEILPNFPNFRISESLRRKTRSSSATSKAGLAVSEDSIADSDWRLALVEHGSMDQISGHLWVTCGSPVGHLCRFPLLCYERLPEQGQTGHLGEGLR